MTQKHQNTNLNKKITALDRSSTPYVHSNATNVFLVHSLNVRNKILYTAKEETYNNFYYFGGTVATTEAASIAAHRKWMTMLYARSIFVGSSVVCVRSVNQLHVRLNVTLQLYWHWCRINNSLEGITKSYVPTHRHTEYVRVLYFVLWMRTLVVLVCLGYYYVQQQTTTTRVRLS